MLDLIWNLFQDEDIDRLRAERRRQEAQSDELQMQSGSTRPRYAELEMRHEQLKLVTLALWRLRARCSRSVLNTAIICPYCGTRQEPGDAFDRA